MAKHLAILDRELCDLAYGRNKRLIVQMPPRHGKSELCSKYFPAWFLGLFPDRNLILTSATDDLAMDFSAAARDLLQEHGSLFGTRLREDRASMQRWQTEDGGGLRAAGVGGGIMGRGADGLIIDDYFKNVEAALSETQRTKLYQWYLSTSGTRLSPRGWTLIIATRWHKHDLIGQVLAEAEKTGREWRVINFPAIGSDGESLWPRQWPADVMQAKREEYYASGYSWMWEALYQQRPPEVLDAEWPAEYFGDDLYFEEWPEESEVVWRVMSLDPSLGRSKSSDYSVYVMGALGTDGVVYVDADIQRRDVRRIAMDGLEHNRTFRPHVWAVETNGFLALEELILEMADGVLPPTAQVTQHQNKRDRLRLGLTRMLAERRYRFKRRSPGVALLLEQLQAFPNGHDDGPDALETMTCVLRDLEGSGLPSTTPDAEHVTV